MPAKKAPQLKARKTTTPINPGGLTEATSNGLAFSANPVGTTTIAHCEKLGESR